MLDFFRKRWKKICGELTFAELFSSYKKEKFPEIAKLTQNGYLMAYKHAARLHDMIFTEIKLSDLSAVIRDVKDKGKGYYAKKFKRVCRRLGMSHYPHDCRHTAATLLSNAEANPVSIKRILGHASQDVTEKVYTHKDLRELIKAIDLI